ncbi:DUF998 domain-containing protein [Actinoplanes sp. CA-131856]
MTSTPAQDRMRLGGGLLWFASLLWFFGQYAAQAAWRTPYSLTRNYVSDLGATTCGDFPAGSGRYVCSPLHAVMNTSFVLWGTVWLLGGLLFAAADTRRSGRLSYGLIALGGLGTIVVGLVPENADFTVHSVAAAVQTFAVAAGLAVLGAHLLRTGHRAAGTLTVLVAFTSVAGIVATAAAESSGAFAGIGLGVWERGSLWPLPIWLAAAGTARLWSAITLPRPPYATAAHAAH